MSKEQTIHLTGRPAVRIQEDDWPVIARAIWHDAETPALSTDRAWVRVRRHVDGSTIVYGLRAEGSFEQKVGFLIDFEDAELEDVTEAIQKTCSLVGIDPQLVFDDMPPEPL